MAMDLLLCKLNYGWDKAGSAAAFALLEAVLISRKQGVCQGQKRGQILYLQRREECTGAQLIGV